MVAAIAASFARMNQFARYGSDGHRPEPVEGVAPATPGSPTNDQAVEELASKVAELEATVAELRAVVEELRLNASQPTGNPDPPELSILADDAQEPPQEPEPEIQTEGPVAQAEDDSFAMDDEEIRRLLDEAATHAMDPETTEPEPDAVKEDPIEEPEPVDENEIEFDPSAVAKVPADVAIAALAVPVRIEEGALVCMAVEPFDHAALGLIAEAANMKVQPQPAPTAQVLKALRAAYRGAHFEAERESVADIGSSPKKRTLLSRLKRRAA